MCTVTFSPRPSGYALAMNRDEKLTRVAGLPPARHRCGERTILCPSEPGGGTWISLNDRGVCVALINWYAVQSRVEGAAISRGDVVKAAAALRSAEAMGQILAEISLWRVNPFRLIGVFPADQQIVEWRWNLRDLVPLSHQWEPGTWISSGHDEPGAQQTREVAFKRACCLKSTGSLGWLRRLHRSHTEGQSPYSTCMHRSDAATVSYTEVSVRGNHGIMGHVAGSPCCAAKFHRNQIRITSELGAL